MIRLGLLFALIFHTAALAENARRIAVVVGANRAAPGRMELRYAHSDARRVAAVLREVGQFAPDDVHLLLDPEPDSVLATLDVAARTLKGSAGESLLLFYYSGHGDDGSLYPAGQPLALAALKQRLDHAVASVRVGIVDACRGGGWTRTKGLKPTQPFEVRVPFELTAEGSALVASSSGSEDAHESDALGGSFFTHHLIAGLRGAADTSADGEISLSEAFRYTREQTVRDSSVLVGAAQNPSFDFTLRGRNDLVLSRVSRSTSVVTFQQREGPLTLVDLDSGVVLLQTDAGRRELRLALPPGHYLVRRITPLDLYTYAFSVAAVTSLVVDERQLQAVRLSRLVSKGPEEVAVLRTSLPAHSWRMRAGVLYLDAEGVTPDAFISGFEHLAFFGSVLYAASDRLQWSVPQPAFTYRFGERGNFETLLYGGMTGLRPEVARGFGVSFSLIAGTGVRVWSGSERSVNAAITADSEVLLTDQAQLGPKSWRFAASLGFSRAFTPQFAMNLGLRVSDALIRAGRVGARASPDLADPTVVLGGVQTLGLYDLPLLRFQITDVLFFDFYSVVGYRLKAKTFTATIGIGFSWELL